MTGPSYPAARVAARRIQPHFSAHLAEARQEGGAALLAVELDVETIEAIIDAAFWASLRQQEGYKPRISLAYLAPEHTSSPLLLENALPLAADALALLAPAVERAGIHLGVWRDGESLRVWGTTRMIPAFCFVLEVVNPGLLVIKHRRQSDTAKFVNLAVLEGDRIKVLDDQDGGPLNCPALPGSWTGFGRFARSGEPFDILVELATSMRAHGKGGSLLVVPEGSDDWRSSVIHPIAYKVAPAFTELADLMREAPVERRERRWQDALRRSVAGVAGLTAVDGATVITDTSELLAFGVKIARKIGSPQVERVLVTEPVEGAVSEIAHPSLLGGTRHLSAAQFVHDQRDSVALVASQDGRFTVFAWSQCEEIVHAHRVESRLM